jgi:hypothetical protein
MTTTLTKTDINSPLKTNKSEIELLLCCARSKMDEKTKVKVEKLVSQEIDWDFLLAIAKRHKLLPLLYYHLNTINDAFIPSEIIASLRSYFQINIQRNLLLTFELLKLLKIFKEHQIVAIPLKGPVLATFAYGNFGLRSISDLDIIVDRSDFLKAEQLLSNNKYQADINNDIENKQQGSYINSEFSVSVDLHYNFAPKNYAVSVKINSFFKDLQLIAIANTQVDIFSTENLVLYLCLEGSKEYWRKISRLCDLAELIQNDNLDWDLLLARAKSLEKERVLFLGIFLVKKVLNASIPNNIWQLVEKNLSFKLSIGQINEFLFTQNFDGLLALRWHLFNLHAFCSIPEKLKYCWQVIKVNYRVRYLNKNRPSLKLSHSKY